jgi:Monooxygenase af470-like
MAKVIEGRQTASYEGDLVVFLIGMRLNKLRAFRTWIPVARAMGPMLRELMRDPDSGLLGFRQFMTWRGVTMVQYWSSVENLQAFANDPGRTHRPAWLRFFKDAYAGGSTGIWHETYVVPAGAYESIYGNMSLLGLGLIAGVRPATGSRSTAAQRLGRSA